MTDIERWFADPENPKDLAEALNLPIVRKALEIITTNSLPSGFVKGDAALMTAQAVQNWNYSAGFYDAFRKLKNLSVSLEPKEEEVGAFDPKWMMEWHENRQKMNQPNQQ